MITVNCRCSPVYSFEGRRTINVYPSNATHLVSFQSRSKVKFKVFASKRARKKLSQEFSGQKLGDSKDQGESSESFLEGDGSRMKIEPKTLNDISDSKISASSPSRNAVLQACVVTSALMLALGGLIRQVSHVAFTEGWAKSDSAAELSFHFQLWHLELIGVLVAAISTSRYILLQTWPSFAESSEAANEQVLRPLEPLDYIVVACLPGLSEEFLFRGGLLPIFGLNWPSALAVGGIFGFLHLGSGRKYSFAAWATFVGFLYGAAAIASSSIIVPMAAHSLNNLIGGFIWYSSASSKSPKSISDE
ncbi:CAAX amino terminal protease family protein [Wolffia australiana]